MAKKTSAGRASKKPGPNPIPSTSTPPPGLPSSPNSSAVPPGTHITWRRHQAKFLLFDLNSKDENGKIQVAEFKVRGMVSSAFLDSSQYSHTISINISLTEIQKIKDIVCKSPPYTDEADGFRWPFMGTEAKFTSRDNLDKPYENLWDGRGLADLDDYEQRPSLSASAIEPGTKVLIEYTVVTYGGRKSTDDDRGFNPGCTLSLLSVGLVDPDPNEDELQFDFESPSS